MVLLLLVLLAACLAEVAKTEFKKLRVLLACHIKLSKNILRDFPATPEFFLSVIFVNLVHPVYIYIYKYIYIYMEDRT